VLVYTLYSFALFLHNFGEKKYLFCGKVTGTRRFFSWYARSTEMMNKNWMWALGIVSLATSVFAQDLDITAAQQPPVQAKPMGVTTQPTTVITPPVAPTVTRGADVFLYGDFIYWRARQEGLYICQSGTLNAAPATQGSTITTGNVQEAHASFEPGFKVGLGMEFAHDGWDLVAVYTWLNPTTQTNSFATNTTNQNNLQSVFQNIYTVSSGFPLNLMNVSSSWKLNTNIVDLDLGRNFFVSQYLTMRPHCGLKGAWFKQDLNIQETLATPVTIAGGSYTNVSIHPTESVWGIGVRGGMDTVWHFCKGWGIYLDSSVTTLWASYTDKRHDQAYNATNNALAATDVLRNSFSTNTVLPVVEFNLGLTYMTWFNNNDYMFDLKAGWEEQVWFNMNRFYDWVHQGSRNLTYQGFTFQAGFHF
jgi:hypothetical protein